MFNHCIVGSKRTLSIMGVALLISTAPVAYAQDFPVNDGGLGMPVPAQPAQDLLSAPQGQNEAVDSGVVDTMDTVDALNLPPLEVPAEDVFFDAEDVLPTASAPSTGQQGTLSRVDPRTDLGSRLIVVNQDHNPQSRTAQMTAADRAFKLGRYQAALSLYDALYERDPRDPKVLWGRALSLQKLGQNESAMIMYEELLEVRPDNLDAQVNRLGLLMYRYPAVALRKLQDLRGRHPQHVGIVAQLSVLYAAQGRYDDALAALEMAATIEPHNANHVFNMAVINDNAGRTDEAMKMYEKALEIDTIHGQGGTIPRDAVFARLAEIR